jgi:hypothetical protein
MAMTLTPVGADKFRFVKLPLGSGAVACVAISPDCVHDDAKNNDLIFVGSPSENLTLQEIPGTHEFVFQRLDSGPRKGDLAIANLHPRRGESGFYVASPSASPLTEDYAVLGFLPGIDPSHSVLIIAGTTTFGTQGAVEFVTGPDSLAELLRRLSLPDAGDLKPFEALLRVKITKGSPSTPSLFRFES